MALTLREWSSKVVRSVMATMNLFLLLTGMDNPCGSFKSNCTSVMSMSFSRLIVSSFVSPALISRGSRLRVLSADATTGISSIQDSNMVEKALSNNGLVGYRIVYISDSGARQDYYRIITSNNRCEPVVQAPNSSSDKSYTYRYDDASPLTFVTVSPSSAPTFKENATPFIGKPTQKILLVNTYFEPIMLDIEMTTHDADTISNMLEGSQLRDLDNGLVTTYNDRNEIYNQSEHFTLKDQYTGKPVYEVKQNKNNNVDFSQTIDDKIS